jgi:3-phytase
VIFPTLSAWCLEALVASAGTPGGTLTAARAGDRDDVAIRIDPAGGSLKGADSTSGADACAGAGDSARDGADGGSGKAAVSTADRSTGGGPPAMMPAANARAAGTVNQDDMAFWIHPTDGAMSMLIASDRQARKLFVYDNAGRMIQTIAAPGKPGNIDVRYDFPLGNAKTDIVAFNDRGKKEIAVYAIDAATRQISRVDNDAIDTAPANYGFCLYQSKTGKFYGFVTFEVPGTGKVQQFELADDGAGKVKGTKVREWTFPTTTFGEACVVDDENATLYYADEPNGIYAVGAEPTEPTPGALFTKTGQNGLTADVEGLTIYSTAGGGGYLIASSQGSDTFKIYDRKSPHAFRGTFTVMGAVHTDGVEVTNANIGGAFVQGCFVAHGGNDAASNFMVKWQDIAGSLGLTVDTSHSPRR